MRKLFIAIVVAPLAALLVLAGAYWLNADSELRALLLHLPTNRDVLFWSTDQRDAAFRALDRIPVLSTSRVIRAGGTVRPLPEGKPLAITLAGGQDMDAYMRDQRSAGILILHKGAIRFERYGLGHTAQGKWTSFSVAKSFTSTLVGAAIQDGHIRSLDDKVSQYVTGLKGSAYDDVSIRQLLTMTSGVKWNEDYTDPQSDVARFNEHQPAPGVDATVSYLRSLPREAPPGRKWVYKTGETNLIGVLVSSATGKPLADYLSEKIWAPYGMQQDATWILGRTGHEISGCCIQAALRDYARLGQLVLEGGVVQGKRILPDEWLRTATTNQVGALAPRAGGYGFQWWPNPDGSFAARGIFGQGIFIDPARQLVIASNSNWLKATDPSGYEAQRDRFYRAVQAAVDADAAR